MLCPTCFGHRLFYYQGVYLPSPDCEGHGALHCCDGLQAQPETVSHDRFARPDRADRWHEEPAAAAG